MRNLTKKKAYAVTWDNYENSSSDSDSDFEQANLCFMESSSEVQTDLSYDELFEFCTEVHRKYRLVKDAKKDLIWKLYRVELEINMLRDEKVILEEELKKLSILLQ